MSIMTWEEAAYDEAMSALYEEHKEQAIQEFTIERLQSYYIHYPDIAKPALKALTKA